MRRRAILAISLGAAAALVAGCEKAGGGATETFEVPAPKVEVTLLDPGAAPRAPLRYRWPVGAAARLEHSLAATDFGGGKRNPRDGTRIDLELRVVERDDVGRMHWQARFVDVQMTAPTGASSPIDGTRRLLRGKGMVLDAWMDGTGAATSPTRITAAKDAADEDPGPEPESWVVLPREPVGVGARWRNEVRTPRVIAMIDYTLIARHGDQVEVREAGDGQYWFPKTRIAAHVTSHGDWHLDLGALQRTLHLESRVAQSVGGKPTGHRELRVDIVPLAK
jgi:hypothetical protein